MYLLKFYDINPRKKIQLNLSSSVIDIQEIVKCLASIQDSVDIYCWYSGPWGLPRSGAEFMTDKLFRPLYMKKKDVVLRLYSLRGWQFDNCCQVSKLGASIIQLKNPILFWMESSSFFQFCIDNTSSPLYELIKTQLPEKKWLFELSEQHKLKNKTLADFIGSQTSLLDCINDMDVARAYSAIQYVETYYLIRESIKHALNIGNQKIQIAFVLANDEGKYYQDLNTDLGQMLEADFGSAINACDIEISFHFFKYGKSPDSRPYLGKDMLKPIDICGYFEYLNETLDLKTSVTQGSEIKQWFHV